MRAHVRMHGPSMDAMSHVKNDETHLPLRRPSREGRGPERAREREIFQFSVLFQLFQLFSKKLKKLQLLYQLFQLLQKAEKSVLRL